MADDADRAADLQAAEIAGALEKHRFAQLSGARRVVACVDCREELTPARRAMGACRCVDCQTDRETTALRYARR
jgi:hypothetical protein